MSLSSNFAWAPLAFVLLFLLRDAALRVNWTSIRKHMSFFRSSAHWCCPVLKKSSFNRFLKYSVVCINGGCEWGKPTSDKGRKILLTTDRTRKKLPTTDRKNINRHYRYLFHKEEYFVNFSSLGSDHIYVYDLSDGPMKEFPLLLQLRSDILQRISKSRKSYLKNTTPFISYIFLKKWKTEDLLFWWTSQVLANLPENEGIEIVCRAYENFYKGNPFIPTKRL